MGKEAGRVGKQQKKILPCCRRPARSASEAQLKIINSLLMFA
jgi:hypothetical protein